MRKRADPPIPDLGWLERSEGRRLERLLELDLERQHLFWSGGIPRARGGAPGWPAALPFARGRRRLLSRGLGRACAALRQKPAGSEGQCLRGRWLLALGRAEEAAGCFSASGGLADERWPLLVAEAFLGSGEVDAARRRLERAASSGDAWAWAWLSETLRACGEAEAAREAIEQALARDPASEAFLILRGRLGLEGCFDRALAASPGSFWALAHRGWSRLAQGRPEQAAMDFGRLAAARPGCAWGLAWRAAALEAGGDRSGARRAYERAAGLEYAGLWAYSRVAREAGLAADPARIVADCEERLAQDPRDAAAYALRGACRYRSRLGLQDLERAVELEPRRAWPWLLLAHARDSLGRVEAAAEAFARACKLEPRCAWFRAWRGEFLARRGRGDQGGRELELSLRLDPSDFRAWAWRGMLDRERGRLLPALEKLDRAGELSRQPPPWLRNERRHVLWALGLREAAFEELAAAARGRPDLGFASLPVGESATRALLALRRAARRGGAARAWLGETLLRLGRPARSLRAFLDGASLSPGPALAEIWRAEALLALGRRQGAWRGLSRAVEADPRAAGAYALRAELHARAGRHREAAEDLGIFARLSPCGDAGSLYRARLLRRAGRAAEAAGLLADLLSLEPEDPWAHQERALCRLALGQQAQAWRDQCLAERCEAGQAWSYAPAGRPLARLEKRREFALEELRDFPVPGAAAWRGALLLLGGELRRAGAELAEALRADPRGAWTLCWIGELRLRQGRPQEAQRLLDLSLESEELGWALALRGEARLRRGLADGAQRDFRRALELDPEAFSARLGLARLRESEGRLAQAEEEVGHALAWLPRAAWLWAWRGRLRLVLEAWAGAEADFSAALAIHPGYADASYGRGRALQELGRPREALRELDAALRLDPRRAELRVARGVVLRALGRYGEQLGEFSRAARLEPGRFGALAGAGR